MTVLLVILALVAALLLWLHLSTRRIAAGATALVPKVGRTTPVAGGEIHWVEEGEGPVVLCLHGLAGNHRHFAYAVAPRLAERGFRAISIDRPGCGWSERPDAEAARLPRQAAMIAEFMAKEGLGPCVVAGHSLGGALALTLALEHPETVSALALICPLTRPQERVPPVFGALAVRTGWLREALAQTVAVPLAKRTGEATLKAVFAPETPPDDFLTAGGGALGLSPKGFRCASEDLAAVPEALPALAPRWPEVTAPGGILYGAGDALLDPASQGEATAAAIAGFDWETLPGRGHMIPFTAPDETAAFIARMAAKAPAG